MKLSAVVNTRNEEATIVRCLRSIVPHVDEIVVVDMDSSDKTLALTKQFTKKIYKHEPVGYVEPARNFAIAKATGDWILIVDADEIVPDELGLKLRRLADHADYDFYRIPRKNIIFGKVMRYSGWWPDHQIRFFKKGSVTWSNEIHSIPTTFGRGLDLPAEEKNALIHHHYENISQYIERLNRYTTQQARQLQESQTTFDWKQLILSPASEFFTRFFVWEGYKDGLHGLALSFLQAFSFLVVQLKLWEYERFVDTPTTLDATMDQLKKVGKDAAYWYFSKLSEQKEGLSQKVYKLRAKLRV